MKPISVAAPIDQGAMARSFGRASSRYDSVAEVQRIARDELLSRLDHFKLKPATILDLGAGTGLATPALKQRFPRARIVSLDLAVPMLHQAKLRQRQGWAGRLQKLFDYRGTARCWQVAGDAGALPLVTGSVQLVFSNLMLQWCMPPDRVLAEVSRVLAPDGLLLLSTFGPLTLQELRAAWATVDDQPHVNDFTDMHDLGSAIVRAGLSEPVLDADRLQRQYAQVADLLRELKALGAGNALDQRRRSLTGKRRLSAMISAYEAMHSTTATWEIVYASAFAAKDSSDKRRIDSTPEGRGEVTIAVESLQHGRTGRRR